MLKKIKTAMSLSPSQFFKVLKEKFFSFMTRNTHIKFFRDWADTRARMQLIENPRWMSIEDREWEGARSFLSPDEALEISQLVSSREKEAIIRQADEVLAHRFDLLGSGPVFVGDEIDWHTDFKSGRTWEKVLARESFIIDPDDDSDIKFQWELSRHQHFVTLGQAYLISRDEKYAIEFRDQVLHWIKDNPIKIGVNWMCSMDIGLRAVSWVWALSFFASSPSLDYGFWESFYKVLKSHADYVFNNLEDWAGIRNNHYISNGTALVIVALACPNMDGSKEWLAKGREILEEGAFKHTLDDGVNYEMSTAYHRLVLEMLLSPAILADKCGEGFDSTYWARLEKAFEFVQAITKPDGNIALFGDADNGRVQILSEHSRVNINDHRYLLAIGAVLFEREDFAFAASGIRDEALWLLGSEYADKILALDHTSLIKEVDSLEGKAFKNGGFYLMKSPSYWLFTDVGPRGIPGAVGVHGHNDATSFELSVMGVSAIVDSGTHAYSGDPKAHFKSKSSAAHNLLIVNDEQISTTPFDLWVIGEEAKPEVLSWSVEKEHIKLEAAHHGYERFENSIRVEREFLLDLNELSIEDRAYPTSAFENSEDPKAESLELRFHTPLRPQLRENKIVLTQGNRDLVLIEGPFSGKPFIEEDDLGWTYGELRPEGYVFGWRGEDVPLPWIGKTSFSVINEEPRV